MTSGIKGVAHAGAQSVRDLFRWKVRATYMDEHGNEYVEWESPQRPPNILRLLKMLTLFGWGAYLVGFLAWTADAFDFHALSIQTVKLAKHFGVSKTRVTEAITLTLLLRSVGAAIFGVFADYFGRKYPLVINMWLLGALQIATIYAGTFHHFLAIRALFGLCMGGVYGAAAGMAMENIPSEARGLFSGIFQSGYSFGYIMAACCNLGFGAQNWSKMFWVGAGLSFGIGFLRLLYPESKIYVEARRNKKPGSGTKAFVHNLWVMLKQDWALSIYSIILMSWFNWLAHASQDSYTTFMTDGKLLNNSAASRASIWMKTGACVGGPTVGYLSQWVGRRRAMIVACLVACCLIPAWILPNGESHLTAGGFFLQSMVQGSFGVIPIYLNEISPPAFRSIFVGVTYQIGNAISSPSTQIINHFAETNTVQGPRGKRVEAYGPVMGIATVIIALGLVLTAAVGPEKRGLNFEVAHVATERREQIDLDSDSDFKIRTDFKEVNGDTAGVYRPDRS